MTVLLLIISSISIFFSAASHNNSYAQGTPEHKKILRICHFPNVNHVQAIIGFQSCPLKQLGDDIDVQILTFNAGPSAIESLLGKRIDVTYVGSNPAINGMWPL